MVLQTLTRQERKLGTTGSRYMAEKDHYEEAMNSVFINLLVRKIVPIPVVIIIVLDKALYHCST